MKVVGEAKSIFVIEESDNQTDWTLYLRLYLTPEAAEAKYEQYQRESPAAFVRLVQFNRGQIVAINKKEEPIKRSR